MIYSVDTLDKWGGGARLLTASPDVCTLCVDTPKGNVCAQGSLWTCTGCGICKNPVMSCKCGLWMASLRVYGVDGVAVVHPYDCM